MTELVESRESGLITDEVIAAYNSSRKVVTRRIAFFESDGITPWRERETSRQAIEGTVSVDGSRDERRTISIKILNLNGVFDNKPDGFWYDKIIKAYRGMRYWSEGTQEYKYFEYKLGEFMIDTISRDANSPVVEVNGRDYTKKLLLDQFDEPTSFNEGSNVDELIKTIAINGGIKKFKLNTGTVNINAIIAFEAETSRWEAIKKICDPFNIEVFFNNEGQLESRLFKDVSNAADSGFHLNVGGVKSVPRNAISSSGESSDGNVFNAVRVYATAEQGSVTGARFVAVRENNDPESPTSIQRIGRRPTTYSSDLFTSQQQVDQYADNFLTNSLLQDYSLSFESVTYPWLEANDVIQVYEEAPSGFPTRYLLSEFSLPIGLGPMSGSGKRITRVGHVDKLQE